MKNINLIKIIKKKFRQIKKGSMNENTDILEDFILDSLELMNLIVFLEKKYKFDMKKYTKKFKNFKIKNLEKFLSS